jgi:hypothetical protein
VRSVITAIAVVALVGAAPSQLAAAPTHAAAPVVLRFLSVTTSDRVVDKRPKGPSAGDRETSTSRLINAFAQLGKPRAAVVGSDRATLVLRDPRTAVVDGTTRIPGGTIRFRGRLRLTSTGAVVPVVGGTGRYRAVRGTLTIVDLTAKRALNVYRLEFSTNA